jgi:hypothetical protein
VLFQKIPDDKNYNNIKELKLSADEWKGLSQNQLKMLQLFMRYLESEGLSTQERQEHLVRVLGHENEVKRDFKNEDIFVCKIPMEGNNHMITLKWDPVAKDCFIDFRKGCQKSSIDGEFRYWKSSSEEGICFNGNSFKYLTDFVGNKISNSLRMWKEMQMAGTHLWVSLLSTYESQKGEGVIKYKRLIPCEDESEIEWDKFSEENSEEEHVNVEDDEEESFYEGQVVMGEGVLTV